jgi:hypothetical protein
MRPVLSCIVAKLALPMHPLEHHPAGQRHLYGRVLQRLTGLLAMVSDHARGAVGRAEIVGEGHALNSQRGELGTALGDDLVLVMFGRRLVFRGGVRVVAHGFLFGARPAAHCRARPGSVLPGRLIRRPVSSSR